jgi:hypothetical protein
MNKPISDTDLCIRCAELVGIEIDETADDQDVKIATPHGTSYGSMREEIINNLPNPLNDRNDLHDLIMSVPEEKRTQFTNLIMCRSNFDRWALMTPSPRLVCEVFLEVMG